MPLLKICKNKGKQHGFGTMSKMFYLILLAGFVSANHLIGPEISDENSEKLIDTKGTVVEAAAQKQVAQEVKHDEVKQVVEPQKVETGVQKNDKSKGDDEEKVVEKTASEVGSKVDTKADPREDTKTDPKPDSKTDKADKKAEAKDPKLANRTESHLPGPEMESGAMRRGVLVFVALGVLFIMYVGFKTYCGRKSASQSVRKYGIRGRRSDIEMTPLPLDEEDDETVFDVGNLNR